MSAQRFDAYRLGFYWWERWSMARTLAAIEGSPSRGYRTWRPSSDRYKRAWQCEWEGCRRAARAYTRQGSIRKAARVRRREVEG